MKEIILLFGILCSLHAPAQKKIKTLEVSDTIIAAAVDRPGDFYVITKEGQIQKFDKDGKLSVLMKHQGAPTLFDPRDGARLFAYYRDLQQYEYYNPSFEITASYRIDPAFAIEPWLICPSGDLKLWVLDKADHSLKKLNARQNEVEIEVKIDSTVIEDASAFSTIREYQGFVFALHPGQGIYIFNSLGKYIRTINASGIPSFNFIGEELYYLHKGKLILFNLFTGESRELTLPDPCQMAMLTDERLLLITHRSVHIFEFKP